MKAFIIPICLALLTVPALAASALLREPGTVYLEDLDLKPVKLTVIGEPAVFTQIAGGRMLGVLRKGSVAELVAVSDTAIRVRGTARQGGVVGWVDAAGLTPLKAEYIESLKHNAKRKAEVEKFIAKGEAALNMTPEEVSKALGRPQKKNAKLDAKGRQETWEFIRYARELRETTGYDAAGRLVTTYVSVKIPSGKLIVGFENSLVASLEKTEGNTDVPGPVRIVPAPLILF